MDIKLIAKLPVVKTQAKGSSRAEGSELVRAVIPP